MFSAPEFNPNVPAFISKLWHMLSDSSTNDLICWAKEGTSFIIHDQVKFSTELLPKYYKHNNMASFIRQLNMYGFHKVLSIDSASMKSDSNELGFSHPYFIVGHPHLLDRIKRKMTNSREIISDFKGDPKLVNKLLHEVQQLQNRQELFDSKLAAMKNENDALWREHSILRQKHAKQQKIVNKLIQFLVTLVQQTRGLNVKRLPLPLMIKDGGNHSSDPINLISETIQGSPSGPIICEVDPSDISYEESDNDINKLGGGRTLLITMKTQDKNLDKYIQSSGNKMKPTENITVTSLPLEDVDSANVIQKLGDSTLRKSSVNTNRALSIPKPHKTDRKRKYSAFDDVLNTPDVPPVYIEDDSPSFKRNLSDYPQLVDDTVIDGRLNDIKQNEPSDAMSVIDLPLITTDDLTNDTPAVNGHTESTVHKTSEEQNELNNQCDENKDLSLVPTDPYTTNTLRGEIDSHLEVMQSDFDILKDILKGEGLSLDASTLLELFSSDDPMALNMTNEIQDYDSQTDESAGIGSELIAYPHLFLNDADTVKQGKVELKYLPSTEVNISTTNLTDTLKQQEGSLNYGSTDLNIPTSSLDDAAQNINFLTQKNSPVKYNEP